MTQFSVPWTPKADRGNYGYPAIAASAGVAWLIVAAVLFWITQSYLGGHPVAMLFLVVGPVVLGLASFAAAFFVQTWRIWRVVLLKIAGLLLIGAVVGSCILVWAFNVLFSWVSVDLVEATSESAATTWFGWPLTLDDETWDRERLQRDCIEPWQALEREGVGVHVGEWGAFRFTPHPVALAWMRDCLELWQEAGWGWALWNLRGAFGILDSEREDVEYEPFRGHQLDREMLELLRRH